MVERDLIKILIDEIYSKPPMRNYPTNNIVYNHVDEKWSIHFTVFSDYKTLNIKKFRYIIIIIDNSSKYVWATPLKNKNSQTITQELSNIPSISKRHLPKKESDRGAE